jgi:hypothetical protein
MHKGDDDDDDNNNIIIILRWICGKWNRVARTG